MNLPDNEIIKALECCTMRTPPMGELKCKKCPAYGNGCGIELTTNILDLINRQQAGIEHFREVTKKIKSDLKYYLDTNEENGVVWIPKFTVDNLVKELTEESDNA